MEPVVDGLSQEYVGRVDFDIHDDVTSDVEGDRLARAHGVSAVPTMMLVDATGRELRRWVGGVTVEDLRAALDATLR